MRTGTADQIRLAVRSLAASGSREISNALVYEAMGCGTREEKDRVRKQITELVARGELERMGRGWLRWTGRGEPERGGETYNRMWRIIRTERTGWDCTHVAHVTRVNLRGVQRYVAWLVAEGLVAERGKRGNTRLYGVTQEGIEQRVTPFPPITRAMPHEAERAALCRLVRLFVEGNLGERSVRERIAAECRTIIDGMNMERQEA